MLNYIYYRFLYRHIMKFAHKYGWHHMKTIYPDGDTMLKCEWCGIRVVTKRRERTLEELAQEHSTGAL